MVSRNSLSRWSTIALPTNVGVFRNAPNTTIFWNSSSKPNFLDLSLTIPLKNGSSPEISLASLSIFSLPEKQLRCLGFFLVPAMTAQEFTAADIITVKNSGIPQSKCREHLATLCSAFTNSENSIIWIFNCGCSEINLRAISTVLSVEQLSRILTRKS